jgi:hypothetical protein
LNGGISHHKSRAAGGSAGFAGAHCLNWRTRYRTERAEHATVASLRFQAHTTTFTIIQVEDAGELSEVYARLREAGGNIIEQGQTACCYAKSEKSWIDDPAGIAWET